MSGVNCNKSQEFIAVADYLGRINIHFQNITTILDASKIKEENKRPRHLPADFN